METPIEKHHKTIGSLIHISTFSKYFIPFGNFIVPLVLWMSNKNQSEFVDYNGKQALNFQVSLLLYSIVLGLISIPFFLMTAWNVIDVIDILRHNTHQIHVDIDDVFSLGSGLWYLGIVGIIGLGIFVLDVFCTIIAAIRANEGIAYRYPLTIKFIK
jgi:uncharacterized Tic20 family protein